MAAEPGEKPAGLYVRQAKALFTIESIDKAAGGGELRDSAGNVHFVKVRDPAVLDRVKVGETVVVTVTDAVRIEVVAPDALRAPPHARRRRPRDGDRGDAPRVRGAGGARAPAARASSPRSRPARTSA